MTIFIKNMVCDRCNLVVKSIIEGMGLHPIQIELGEVELQESDISNLKEQLVKKLHFFGFELLDDKKTKTIEKVKNLITELVHKKDNNIEVSLSEFLSKELHQNYSSLSKLFSEVEEITIEKYYILQKIEKVKELLAYDELTLSEIAYYLNYSSVAYLSNQFKKTTGLTPSNFKKLGTIKRNPLDGVVNITNQIHNNVKRNSY